MNNSIRLVMMVAVVIGVLSVAWYFESHRYARPVVNTVPALGDLPKTAQPTPVAAAPAIVPESPLAAPQTETPPAAPPAASARQPQSPVVQAPRHLSSPSEPLVSEPVAREALALVGTDPVAEVFWTQAINDPNLLPDQRRELIEDLNQDGFADAKNLTPDDLPMIVNRLALIEEMAPNAMDDINAAAFQEAYKDLVNMYQKAGGQ